MDTRQHYKSLIISNRTQRTLQSLESPTGVFPYAIEKLSILAFRLSEPNAS